jgi:spermidine synthase
VEDRRSSAQRSRDATRSATLKICIFATGLAGIVAEYVMATLASYLLGDAIFHWTMTISWMLFAMGVGSRLSRFVDEEMLLDAFVAAELALSLAVAVAAPAVYLLAVWIPAIGTVIYTFSFLIGLLVGLELPLATRLNDRFEELRFNVSAVIEKDYYGALFGGILFAFVALPKLGLTYTPILLGAVNLAVASLLFLRFRTLLVRRRPLTVAAVLTPVLLLTLAVLAEPIVVFGEQMKYRDVVVYSKQTRFQRIVMTRWKNDHWLYLDGNEQFSSYDEELYHEPLVHPALALAARRNQVLMLGGGDGLAAREILKWGDVERLTVVDLDPAMTRLARSHPVLLDLNGGALDDPRVEVVNEDAYVYLKRTDQFFDVILADLPDPKTVSLARLYSRPFYALAARQLTPGGVFVTQATSPFFSRQAFLSILKSVGAAGLVAVPYHNHLPTMGEWGWVVGWKSGPVGSEIPPEVLRDRLLEVDFNGIETRFLNREAMLSMLHFGKGVLDDLPTIEVSEESDLHVFSYYRNGAWDLY